MVHFLDLKAATDELAEPLLTAAQRVMSSGWYIGGEELEAFEREWAAYCGAAHCVGVGNGLDALVLSLRALDIGPGDEVIVPSNTYIATWLAVSATGAKPVPVEPDPATHLIDLDQIEVAITPRTKALMPVHLYGQPVNMDALMELAKIQDLKVIEDAAQAHGAMWSNRRIGAHGDLVCWSFYPGKNLGALGDGGAVTTDDADLADRIRCLGNYGSAQKYIHDERGTNSRLDPLQAAFLRVKLAYLEVWTARRQARAAQYLEALADLPLTLPRVAAGASPVWHLFVIRSQDRAQLQKHLTKAGIGTMIHYPRAPHMQKAYSDFGLNPSDLPIARQLAEEVLSLPMSPHLSESDCARVISAVQDSLTR